MYTKEELSRQRQAFWTAFGQYMRPVPGADGERVNWVNYKTGVPGIYFRMDAGNVEARIGIEMTHTDNAMRRSVYDRFVALKGVLHGATGEEWQWNPLLTDESGRTISRIGMQLQGVNISNHDDWPRLISFFKERIVALDEFWSMVKPGFE
ncbi:MAG: DUF4268 domain-containing protein [Taibaiella sp.]|nr:DUF4268 domain-containing protein [Taibaiella sp.]